MTYFLYILSSKSANKFYVGISQNPTLRLQYHNSFEKGFTARYRPWEIVFTQEFSSKEDASLAERKIKSWKSSKMIQRIIDKEIKLVHPTKSYRHNQLTQFYSFSNFFAVLSHSKM